MPVRRDMATMIIMPINRPIVLKSMPSTAFSWVRMPSTIIRLAPSRAMTARLIRSLITAA
jgi:hypothetical protein